MFGTGVVYGSTLWRLEAVYFAAHGRPLPRAQNVYYRERGLDWLASGAAAGIIACLVLLADSLLRFLVLASAGTTAAIMIMLVGGVLVCLLLFALSGLNRWLLAAIGAVGVTAVGFCLTWCIVRTLDPGEIVAPLLILADLIFDYRFNYRADYRRY